MTFAVGNTVANNALTGSTGTVTISLSAGSVLLLSIHTTATATGGFRTVSSVTSSNLTYARRSSRQHRDTNIGAGRLFQNAEVWWAYSSGALTSEVVTVTLSAAPDTGTIGGVECQNVFMPSSPWDTNASLPAVNDGDNTAAQVTGITTDSGTPVGFYFRYSSGPAPGQPTGFTQAVACNDLGTNSNSEQRVDYEVFSSKQSSVTFASPASTRNWIAIGDAFGQITPPVHSFGFLVGA